MVKRALICALLLAALLVSAVGAACPPMAEQCPMHSGREGCGATAAREPADCCPGTTSSQSTPFQARLLFPDRITADTMQLSLDLQPFLEPLSLGPQPHVAVVFADFNSLFCVLLI